MKYYRKSVSPTLLSHRRCKVCSKKKKKNTETHFPDRKLAQKLRNTEREREKGRMNE